jgi:hypothetical protein
MVGEARGHPTDHRRACKMLRITIVTSIALSLGCTLTPGHGMGGAFGEGGAGDTGEGGDANADAGADEGDGGEESSGGAADTNEPADDSSSGAGTFDPMDGSSSSGAVDDGGSGEEESTGAPADGGDVEPGGPYAGCSTSAPENVCPLVVQQGEVSIALNPLGEEVADDRLRSWPDNIRLFEFFAACNGYNGQLRRKAFNVLGFLSEEALRNQQRKINVLMTRCFEADIEFALENFPDGVSIGLNYHAAFDDLGGLSQVALQNRVLIPRREIFLAWSNWRICHFDISSSLSNPGRGADDLDGSNLKQYDKMFSDV